MTWFCLNLTQLLIDSTTTWLYHYLTLLLFDFVIFVIIWLYYYLTLPLLDSAITWLYYYVTLLLRDSAIIRLCCYLILFLLLDSTIIWLNYYLTLLFFALRSRSYIGIFSTKLPLIESFLTKLPGDCRPFWQRGQPWKNNWVQFWSEPLAMCWHVSLCWLNGKVAKVAMGTSQHGILGVVHCCPTPISVFFWSCIVFCLRYWDLWLLWIWNFDIAFGFDGLAPHQSWVSLPCYFDVSWIHFHSCKCGRNCNFTSPCGLVLVCATTNSSCPRTCDEVWTSGPALRLPRPLRPCPSRPLTLCFSCCFILRHCIFDDTPSNLEYVCFVVFCNCLVVQFFFTQVTEGRTGRCVLVFIGKNMVMNNLVKMKRLSWSADANVFHEVLIHVCKQIL